MTIILTVKEKEYRTEEIINLLTKYRLLPQIAREIIIDETIATIEITAEELEQSRLKLFQTNQITNPEQLANWLQLQGMTEEQLNYRLIRDLKIERYKNKTWENQIESYFLQYKEKYDKVIYSLLRTKNPDLANELYLRLLEGENTFADLAKKYSEGTEAETGGLIGPVELNNPHPIMGQILSHSQAGQLCPPQPIGEWIVIIRLEQYISAQLDENIRQRLINELFQNWLREEMNKVVSYPTQIKQEV